MKRFMKYMALQLPGWVLVGLSLSWLWPRMGWNPWIAGIGYAVFVLKDFLLYPFLRSTFEMEEPTGGTLLIGTTGVAQESLDPDGYVAVEGERWKAEVVTGAGRIPRGTTVRVEGAAGLTLRVAAIAHGPDRSTRFAARAAPTAAAVKPVNCRPGCLPDLDSSPGTMPEVGQAAITEHDD